MALANAFGAIAAVFYLGCVGLISIAPDLYRSTAESWFHGVDLNKIWKVNQGNMLTGLVTFTVVSWISGWLLAFVYNKFAKK